MDWYGVKILGDAFFFVFLDLDGWIWIINDNYESDACQDEVEWI